MKKRVTKKNKIRAKKIKNKNDIKILDSRHDFLKTFADHEKSEFEEKEIKSFFTDDDQIFKKNKHGLPIIKSSRNDQINVRENLRENVGGNVGDEKHQDDFAQLLESSFQNKDKNLVKKKRKTHPKSSRISIKKRLKKYPPPEVDLDLHGFTAAGAEAKVKTFIQNHKREGYFTVRIIVGKGLHSDFGAVLPDIVEDQLKELKKQNLVIFYEWEKKKKSQSGSIIAYLKQFDQYDY